jgi:hypothetical protein
MAGRGKGRKVGRKGGRKESLLNEHLLCAETVLSTFTDIFLVIPYNNR